MDDLLDEIAGLQGQTAALEWRAMMGEDSPQIMADLLYLVEATELVMAAIVTADRDDGEDEDPWAA